VQRKTWAFSFTKQLLTFFPHTGERKWAVEYNSTRALRPPAGSPADTGPVFAKGLSAWVSRLSQARGQTDSV
jgi:hypothetical protein